MFCGSKINKYLFYFRGRILHYLNGLCPFENRDKILVINEAPVKMPADIKVSTVFLFLGSIVFFVLSKILFDNIYLTSRVIVDEEFHLPLGEAYCQFDFSQWDPKVTTLPGLYLLSAAILGPLNLCSIYWLRMISLGFSFVNLFLFYVLFSTYSQGDWRNILSSITLGLLPPLYFFSHVYYTDVVSLTMTLSMIIFSEKGYHYFASVFGFFALMCRQSNIIFVGIFAGKYILTELYAFWVEREDVLLKEGKLPSKHIIPLLKTLIQRPWYILKRTHFKFWLNVLSYLSLLCNFLLFLYLNGGIVVGDKSSHEATIHTPQLFYFTLFCLAFGWPHFMGDVLKFVKFAKRHKLLLIFAIILSLMCVHFNTQVHPYLLADNRHYIFYLWNRFYGKYNWFKYAVVPVYIFGLYVLIKNAWNKHDVSFAVVYLPAIILLLITQKLIELRYFIVPYILLRLRLKNTDSAVFNVILEFVTFCIMNMITFNIFFKKTIKWDDWDELQRIIW